MVVNAVLGLWQEAKAEAAVAALAKMTAPLARVVRDGSTVEIPTNGGARRRCFSAKVTRCAPTPDCSRPRRSWWPRRR
ncbi:MAG: hypothetical protein R2710_26950 [Acidimicrobiales bacterium]